jgi:hypothetical protein
MKTRFVNLVFIVVAGTMAACASNPTSSVPENTQLAQASNYGEGVICTTERSMDSFIKEKKCTTLQEREAKRRQQEVLMDVR